jgi:hypothetical protein
MFGNRMGLDLMLLALQLYQADIKTTQDLILWDRMVSGGLLLWIILQTHLTENYGMIVTYLVEPHLLSNMDIAFDVLKIKRMKNHIDYLATNRIK